jgi:hypothetical protein
MDRKAVLENKTLNQNNDCKNFKTNWSFRYLRF